ncbi:hypothetical protein ARMGADRAFT_1036533 [Armillaria gallica]|uniref:Uncharacterized protein n=1 Tax=Armillaria gallica TaxID=47427 RepID=A0A2H3CQC1_ARMGA|nr:hypothetical protein ARMGADRAFT_1036533 [Armillaria gallica]
MTQLPFLVFATPLCHMETSCPTSVTTVSHDYIQLNYKETCIVRFLVPVCDQCLLVLVFMLTHYAEQEVAFLFSQHPMELFYMVATAKRCMMTVWAVRSTRVLFGEVTDEDTLEEMLESIFWNNFEDKTAAFDKKPDKISMLKKIEEVPDTDTEKTYITFLNGGP